MQSELVQFFEAVVNAGLINGIFLNSQQYYTQRMGNAHAQLPSQANPQLIKNLVTEYCLGGDSLSYRSGIEAGCEYHFYILNTTIVKHCWSV